MLTIKGIFVNSHIKAVGKAKGESGLAELERRCGHPLKYANNTDVPISEEIDIINHALEIMSGDSVTPENRDFLAGQLHFKNFLETPMARFIFSTFRSKFKLMMMNANNIAGHIFHGVTFSSSDVGPTTVIVATKNNPYPAEHFRGLLYEWMKFSGFNGAVEVTPHTPEDYELTIHWEE